MQCQQNSRPQAQNIIPLTCQHQYCNKPSLAQAETSFLLPASSNIECVVCKLQGPMQQHMMMPNGYMMAYLPPVPPGSIPFYGSENGAQGQLQ